MLDYSKGQIYTIRNREDDTKIYVGSTIQPLYKRFSGHKIHSKCEKHMTMKLYVEVNDNWDDWYIELYENYPCNTKTELCKREGEVIRLIGTLNSKISGRDNKEWYIDNIDKVKEQKKQYHIDNAAKIKEYRKQYVIENADKIKEKTKQHYIENAGKKKEYAIINKEKIKEYQQQYRLKKKEEKLKELGKATA